MCVAASPAATSVLHTPNGERNTQVDCCVVERKNITGRILFVTCIHTAAAAEGGGRGSLFCFPLSELSFLIKRKEKGCALLCFW